MKILFTFLSQVQVLRVYSQNHITRIIFYNLITHHINGGILRIKKILVPFDNSGYSKRSLKYAVDLAKAVFSENRGKEDIGIFLLHVVHEFLIAKSLSDRLLRDKDGKVISLS